jgi:hypothetical protein
MFIHQHPRYAINERIDEAVRSLVNSIDSNPYSWDRVRPGNKTISDVLEMIAYTYGPRAAASVRITLH